MSGAPISWDDILEEGEFLLWQGRPDTKIVWQKRHILPVLLGLSVAVMGFIWIFLTPLGNGAAILMGLFMLLFAGFLGIAPSVMNAMVRKASWYSLSNRRGFIAMHRQQVGRKLSAYEIDPDFELIYDHKDPATIYFASEIRQPSNASYTVKIGFERIDNGQEVYDMMRDIQKGTL